MFRRTTIFRRVGLSPAGVALALVLLVALAGATRAGAGGTQITVSSTSDDADGDVSSVASLLANPGADGTISLREAILATNNDPGTYTIVFAAALNGSTISVGSDLPPLTGGGVTVDGPDVTVTKAEGFVRTGCPPSEAGCGFQIASSGNTLSGLTVDGFGVGVDLEPVSSGAALPQNVTLDGNTVDGLTLDGLSQFGVLIESMYSPDCGAPNTARCSTYTNWTNTTISGNTIQASGGGGIVASLNNVGDAIAQATITDNSLQVTGNNAGIGLCTAGDSLNARISNVEIARNAITGSIDAGISVTSGCERGQSGVVQHVQILDNNVQLTHSTCAWCVGIYVQSGTDDPSLASLVDPPRYPDGNLTSDVLVQGNTVGGELDAGVEIPAGVGIGGSNNVVTRVGIESNTIATSKAGIGVFVWTSDGNPYGGRLASGNQITQLTVASNQIETGAGADFQEAGGGAGAGGVVLVGGGRNGQDNTISGVNIAQNSITSPYAGLRVIGGSGYAPSSPPQGNEVSGLDVNDNQITLSGSDSSLSYPQDGGIVLAGGSGTAEQNTVDNVQLTNNVIDTTLIAINLIGGLNGGATGNSVSGVQVTNNDVVHAPSLVSAFSWVKGIDLVGGWSDQPSATGNTVNLITLQGNAVAGVADDVSVRSNLGAAASGNIAALGLQPPTLAVGEAGSGAGMIESNPAGIDCGSTCSHEFDDRSQVTLTATASPGSTFAGWSGGCSGTGACAVIMNGAQSVTATFAALYTLTVSTAGSGSGTVTSSPLGIDCGATCAHDFASGTQETLTAAPVVGSEFTGWSGGGCSGTGACAVTMNGAQSVTATFAAVYTLTVSKAGSGSGTVTSSPSGIDCGATCAHDFASGTQETLTAAPVVGSEFTGWSGGGCSGTGACTVTMNGGHAVTASFEAVCIVPKVKGRPLAAARSAILDAGCTVGAVTRAYSAAVKKGRVISQQPGSQTTVAEGTAVRLRVSKGRKHKK